jgi:2-C-methyl-D-erythritol 4-phosphate cytidylyltransferase/2-C-methyl-D-erythritol 2,4-cyclodiphosphate synthase
MNHLILLAAGKSERAGQDKLWADIHGEPLWTLAYQTALRHPKINQIVVVVRKGEEFRFLPHLNSPKTQLVTGGATRMESFKRGLAAISFGKDDVILDHNAANPLLTPGEISKVIDAAKLHGSAALCHPVVDTLVDMSTFKPQNRDDLRLMQTPQAVRGDILSTLELPDSTDLVTAILPQVVPEFLPANPLNKKITFEEDIETLRAQLQPELQHFLGEDSHRFLSGAEAKGTQLTLGGLSISDCPAMQANSDGDVILHAIGRALAQANRTSFSERADALCEAGEKNSSSYLSSFLESFQVTQLSITLEGARPKIDPLIPALKTSLASILQTDSDAISISAHTGEDLSPFGLGEGLRCSALLTGFEK